MAILLIIGVMAGAIARAMPHGSFHHDECQVEECAQVPSSDVQIGAAQDDCCPAEMHSHSGDDKPGDTGGSKEPAHHHHVCCGMSPLVVGEDESTIKFAILGISRTGFSMEHRRAPESPVFELDMPPLI